MRHVSLRKLGLALAALALPLAVFAGLAIWGARRALQHATVEVDKKNQLAFTSIRLNLTIPAGFESLSSAAGFRDAAFLNRRLYVCGPGVLWEFAPDGKLLTRYRVGLELPPAPLVGMAVGTGTEATDASGPELYIATAGGGLLAVGDKGIRQMLPEQDAYRQLTAVLPLSTGDLLLGTERDGVLVYDGSHLQQFHPLLSKARVTALAGDAVSLWVGTVNDGLLHVHAGVADHFGESEGLPDPRVLSIAADGDSAFAGTPMGVAEFRDGRLARVLARGFFANALRVRGRSLLVGTIDEGVLEIPLEARARERYPAEPGIDLPGAVQRLITEDQRAYALTEDGVFALGTTPAEWRRLVGSEAPLLSDDNVSALAFDDAGRLWAGYFDRGLDVLDANLTRSRHVENDNVFCINRIVYDRGNDRILVGTANGLVVFDSDGQQREVMRHADGLIADQVSDIALTSDGMAVGTPAGITSLTPSGARSVYAFEGLINNHVYALAASGARLLAGTLGGLSIVDDGRVLASFTTANSGLRHNWITAILRVGEDWFVGTYGAGILRFDSNGNWQTFADASGALNVNNNAMVADSTHVYAGTLGKGLYVYDRGSGRWTSVAAGLPSLNVTAVALRGGYVYVGTDNGLVRIAEAALSVP